MARPGRFSVSPEAARVEQEAKIAEARANQAAEEERLRADEAVAIQQRQLELKQAEIKAETDEAQAQAAAAGPLREAARNREVIREQELVAEREAELRERQLDAEVRKPADAERYRIEQQAEAAKNAAIFEADAEKARRARMAEAVELEGRAEAEAIRAKGEAEAEARTQNAEAFRLYGEAATLDLIAAVLPELVSAASEPLSAVERMTVISTDGASEIAKTVASNVEQGLQIGTDLTGLDLRGLLASLGGGSDDTGAASSRGAADADA